MIDKINPNIRSIIHILNNWNFTFDGSYVRANLEIHITKAELQQVKSDLENELRMLQTNPNVKVSDEEIKSISMEMRLKHHQ